MVSVPFRQCASYHFDLVLSILYRGDCFTGKDTACEVHKELYCDTIGVFFLGASIMLNRPDRDQWNDIFRLNWANQ